MEDIIPSPQKIPWEKLRMKETQVQSIQSSRAAIAFAGRVNLAALPSLSEWNHHSSPLPHHHQKASISLLCPSLQRSPPRAATQGRQPIHPGTNRPLQAYVWARSRKPARRQHQVQPESTISSSSLTQWPSPHQQNSELLHRGSKQHVKDICTGALCLHTNSNPIIAMLSWILKRFQENDGLRFEPHPFLLSLWSGSWQSAASYGSQGTQSHLPASILPYHQPALLLPARDLLCSASSSKGLHSSNFIPRTVLWESESSMPLPFYTFSRLYGKASPGVEKEACCRNWALYMHKDFPHHISFLWAKTCTGFTDKTVM